MRATDPISSHPTWCIVEEAHSEEDCMSRRERDELLARVEEDRKARPAQYRPID